MECNNPRLGMVIQGTAIEFTRGDAESLTFTKDRLNSDNEYEPSPFVIGDILDLTVRTKQISDSVVIHKHITEFTEDGAAIFRFYPEDTKNLPFKEERKEYIYDIQWTSVDGLVQTLVDESPFILRRDSTR